MNDENSPENASADLIAWDRQYLWHPFTPMKPWCEDKEIVVIERAEGVFLVDTEGRRYIDGVSSLWCNVHGHNVPELNAAVIEQLLRVAHTTLLGLGNVPSIQLARRLVELARKCGLGLDRVFYSDNGSTAVEVACKMAFQYWRNRGSAAGTRNRFLAFSNSYHGDTMGAVSVGGIPVFHSVFKELTFSVDFVDPPRLKNGDAGRDRALAAIDEKLRQTPDAFAAIIIEPLVQGAGGMLMHPPGFLRGLRNLADRHNVLLIADEVLTGFGRTGKMFACEHEAVTPDLLCLSKGLTAGYMPLGVTMTTQKMFDAFYVDPNANDGEHARKTLFHGHTFTGHPLACAVAIKSLDLFEERGVLAHVQQLTPILDDALAAAARHPFVSDVRRCGFIAAIDLADAATRQPFPFHWRVGGELCRRMRRLGLMLRPLGDTLVIMPPLAISAAQLRQLCEGVLETLKSVPEIVQRKSTSSKT